MPSLIIDSFVTDYLEEYESYLKKAGNFNVVGRFVDRINPHWFTLLFAIIFFIIIFIIAF